MALPIQPYPQPVAAAMAQQTPERLPTALEDRIRQLERDLCQNKQDRLQESNLQQREIFQERLRNENLIRERDRARGEVQRLNAQVAGVEQERAQNQQRLALLQQQVNATREEMVPLRQQVALGNQRALQLTAQLQIAIARADALEGQVRRMVDLLEKQQQLVQQKKEPPPAQHQDMQQQLLALYENSWLKDLIGPVTDIATSIFSRKNTL